MSYIKAVLDWIATIITWGASRTISALIFGGILALVYWLVPNLSYEMVRPEIIYCVLFGIFWAYLTAQGHPIAHGNIGSSSEHNWDNMVSMFPLGVNGIALFAHFAQWHVLSHVNVIVAFMAILVSVYDLWILGGCAAKINRLTDEYKPEK